MRRVWPYVWLVLGVPGLYQLGLLVTAVARRFLYPYDLEWMEGGMLVHALRLVEGKPLYAAPSVDFIPYLYTPGYPAVLAGLSAVFGLSYALGRAVSVLALAGVLATAAWVIVREARDRRAGAAGAALAIGLIAATYPWVEGWYDLVRGDTLFLALATGGLALLGVWARRPAAGLRGFYHPPTLICAALLAASFFVKQTGALVVVAGGAALLVLNWRALPGYTLCAAVLGAGGAALLDAASGGWFWIYAFEYHQQHDTNADRFWRSFGNILLHFPAMTAIVVAGLVAVAVLALARRRRPGVAFLYWSGLFAFGCLLGAIGWATQWAHFNAYIPAMVFGAIAAGLAIVELADRPVLALLLAAALGAQLAWARWSPDKLVPRPEDRAAGERLVSLLAAVPGDVFIPFHPWYAHLAGKPAHTHRMGILDVTYVPPPSAGKKRLPPAARTVAGLFEALREGRFAAVVLDDRAQLHEYPGLQQGYRLERTLGRHESPRVVSGAPTVPRAVWVRKER